MNFCYIGIAKKCTSSADEFLITFTPFFINVIVLSYLRYVGLIKLTGKVGAIKENLGFQKPKHLLRK